MRKTDNPIYIFEDLIVKLKGIFKDGYIIKGVDCIGGVETANDSIGNTRCVLEKKYQDVIVTLFGKIEYAFIPSFELLREVMNGYEEVINEHHLLGLEDTIEFGQDMANKFLNMGLIRIIEDEKTIKEITDTNGRFDGFFLGNHTWKSFDTNLDMLKTIFDEKRIYNIPLTQLTQDAVEGEIITVSKQMLPTITEKRMHELHMAAIRNKAEEGLYWLLIEIGFTHFKIQSFYGALPIELSTI